MFNEQEQEKPNPIKEHPIAGMWEMTNSNGFLYYMFEQATDTSGVYAQTIINLKTEETHVETGTWSAGEYILTFTPIEPEGRKEYRTGWAVSNDVLAIIFSDATLYFNRVKDNN